jgi:hypothetical protein
MKPSPEPPEPVSPEPPAAHLPSEAEVTRHILRWAIERGWRCHRNHVGVYHTRDGRPQRINDPGMPDWLFLHPEHPPVWVEVKRPRERPRKIQLEYMAVLQHRGFRVCWTSSAEDLERKFAEWGLL